ncbi:alpha/beta hydrolase [Echinicola jeungdonensis]|uniref:Alpha/beta hydrolase n=1 Tax=Echinicola jeungdonensis TaxID=709343 RepID=A0ABV5J8W1_9BACT|nr:alpha/beta hydrolase [Echinicola jeungdonensis]MDN3670226.1 alpha/beta hydrolase [Echinicola jeungdonensis]
MIKRFLPLILALAIILSFIYMWGPKETLGTIKGEYPQVPVDLEQLEIYIKEKEDTVKGLKADNEARIIWADSLNKAKTPFSFVYIHGFGASQKEGDPVHRKLASHFGANLYLARLPEHGIKRKNALEYTTAEKLTDGAREALMIGKMLGDRVILIGTSMGGSLAILLASEREDIHSLLLYSPCIRDFGNQLEAFFRPWEGWVLKNFMANEHGVLVNNRKGEKAKYWSEAYHVNAYASLAQLVFGAMNPETFIQVKQPLFLAYYYKNEKHQDHVVSVPAMKNMFESVKTKENFKRAQAFPNAGDHVICSFITSNDWEGVLDASIKFLKDIAKVPSPSKEKLAEIK